MPDFVLRDATEADLPAIAAILNREIEGGTGTWSATQRTPRDLADWLKSRDGPGRAALVAVRKGRVVGYGALGPFRHGEGYALTAESSVYVAEGARGRGFGSALLAALIERARADRLHRLVAGIGADNAASLRLHTAQGYAEVGRLPEVGFKFGRRLDLVLLMLRLDV
jgi:phosphinothricin acetyltransferase